MRKRLKFCQRWTEKKESCGCCKHAYHHHRLRTTTPTMTRTLKASTKVQVAAAAEQQAAKKRKEKNGIQSRAKRNNFEKDREKPLLKKAWKSGFSAYGSRQILRKSTKLTAKKVDSFLQGKNSYTKFFILSVDPIPV